MSLALSAQVYDAQSKQSFDVCFERFPVRLGRNQLNELHLDRPYVSQFHLLLELSGHQILVKDLGSTNGTVHNRQRLQRDQLIDISEQPELHIGPLQIRLVVQEVEKKQQRVTSALDLGTEAGQQLEQERTTALAAGNEDPYVQQVAPYIEAYRSAWAQVYGLIYEHLTRLPQDIRERYLKRLLVEHAALGGESDFQQVSQYYGVPAYSVGPLTTANAGALAINELFTQLAPGLPPLAEPRQTVAFARRLRDIMNVFMKAFISLRDGYEQFEIEVLKKDVRMDRGTPVGVAKDNIALAQVLFGHDTDTEDTAHELHNVFVEVMTHQVAMLDGVMGGVKQLLEKLSPAAIEQRYEQTGKKGGLFSNKYEGLWQAYVTVHGDYRGEDAETFRTIFGPGFARVYAATSGEAYQASGEIAEHSGRHLAHSATPRR
jgi:type VI secretion system protein ImpI